MLNYIIFYMKVKNKHIIKNIIFRYIPIVEIKQEKKYWLGTIILEKNMNTIFFISTRAKRQTTADGFK